MREWPHVSPMETLGGQVVRIEDCLIRRPTSQPSLLVLVIPFEHSYINQSKIILINCPLLRESTGWPEVVINALPLVLGQHLYFFSNL